MASITIAFILGDPAGIGPEIAFKSLSKYKRKKTFTPILIGNYASSIQYIHHLKGQLKVINPSDAIPEREEGDVHFYDICSDIKAVPVGEISTEGGMISYESIKFAVDLLSKGSVDAAVMAPISKESLKKAGSGFMSEFELFEKLFNVKKVRAVVKCGSLFRSTVVGHVPFKEIPDQLTTSGIVETAYFLNTTMSRFGIEQPKLAIAALNPHGGEGGLLGNEERTVISPAVSLLNKQGIDVKGIFPADTLMVRARRGDFQGLVYLYHDQGNIAFKAANFGENVLLYTGMPYVVSSVGHGTAFDIAGKGVADEHNFLEAIDATVRVVGEAPS
jgi:4-hydroxythreonine-4-phosphate dehydrogenase